MAAAEQYMRRALALAERGRGQVEPNPLVGAVLVRDDCVVGEGYHERFGGPHAEIHALRQAGDLAGGATLYTTLEPCGHYGKTPPCTQALISAGVARVVAAMIDPAEPVRGAGFRQLREAGVDVQCGVLEQQARRLNAPYLKLLATGMPYVHAKWAMTLDGKTGSVTGDSKWISDEPARAEAHRLRGRMDAIIVGVGTVLADDPLLTARPPGPRTACRVVMDSSGRLPPHCQLARTAAQAPVLVATTDRSEMGWRKAVEAAGCRTLVLPPGREGVAVEPLLMELGRRHMTNVLVEGGGRLLGSFLHAGQIDEVHVFVAAKLLGGQRAAMPIAGLGLPHVSDAMPVSGLTVRPVGQDYLFHGFVPHPWLQPEGASQEPIPR